MPYSYTPFGLQKDIMNDLFEVVSNITKDVYFSMIESVEVFVYIDSDDEQLYKRQGWNGGFIASWDFDLLHEQMTETEVTYKVFSNPDLMILDQINYVHGSPQDGIDGETDRRDMLDVYIAEGIQYDFGANATLERDYFSPVTEYYDRHFDEHVKAEFAKLGTKIIKGKGF